MLMMNEERTTDRFLAAAEEEHGERDAFCFSDAGNRKNRVSFRKLREDADALSESLLRMGFCRERIAVLGENSYDWLLAFFAVAGSGSTAVPMDRTFPVDEALRLLRKTDCSAVVCSDTYEDKAEAFEAAGMKVIRMHELNRMILDGNAFLAKEGPEQILLCGSRPRPEDPAAIYFTSGTNGEQKAVVLSHRNMVADAVNVWEAGKCFFTPDYTGVIVLPLHHVFSMISIFVLIAIGCCEYILHSLRSLVQVLRQEKPQMLFSVPGLMEELLSQARRQGMGREAFGGRLETVFCGGSFVSRECVDAYHALGVEIMPGYGITECSPIVSFCLGPDKPEHCVGTPLACTEVKIAEDGEILVRGENVFSEYYQDPAATAAAFRNGWFLTGDLGCMDEKGRLYVTGRKKNLIILSNGENVAAEELERKIGLLPYVKEILVYEENNRIVAEIYPDPTVENIEARINADIRQLNRSLPIYRNIGKTVVRRTAFPKTSLMKIKRERNLYERNDQ